MKLGRVVVTLALALIAMHPAPAMDTGRLARVESALVQAAAFLVAQQSPDGAWRSDRYGTFRDGLALTPLVAMPLLYLQGGVSNGPAGLAAAAQFLSEAAGPCLRGERHLEYPVYSAALSALVLTMRGPDAYGARSLWFQCLEKNQFSASNGWKSADLPYGGWGYTPHPPRRAGAEDAARYAANISATLFALAALRAGSVPPDDSRLLAARIFVERCQVWPDDSPEGGGFFFSPCPAANNKAGFEDAPADRRPRPYGSATADGLRALSLCGAGRDDPRLRAAVRWLETNFLPAAHPGRFLADHVVWRDGYYFYYAWSSAHALHFARGQGLGSEKIASGLWAEQLADALLARQAADGSWRNRFTAGREDDPLVATSFAAAALQLCRKNLLLPAGFPCPPVHGQPPFRLD